MGAEKRDTCIPAGTPLLRPIVKKQSFYTQATTLNSVVKRKHSPGGIIFNFY